MPVVVQIGNNGTIKVVQGPYTVVLLVSRHAQSLPAHPCLEARVPKQRQDSVGVIPYQKEMEANTSV